MVSTLSVVYSWYVLGALMCENLGVSKFLLVRHDGDDRYIDMV